MRRLRLSVLLGAGCGVAPMPGLPAGDAVASLDASRLEGIITGIEVARVAMELPLSAVCSPAEVGCPDTLLAQFESAARKKLQGCGSFSSNVVEFGAAGCPFGGVRLTGSIAASIICTVPGVQQAAGDFSEHIAFTLMDVGVDDDPSTLSGKLSTVYDNGNGLKACGGSTALPTPNSKRPFTTSSTTFSGAPSNILIDGELAHAQGGFLWSFDRAALFNGDCYPHDGSVSIGSLAEIKISFSDATRKTGTVSGEAMKLPAYGRCGR